ncbi:hypothetical protein B0A49_04277 [Cryomyces minteri]|uniref:Serine aminopeptidase S33 domain-containing protein n=1 Tax=Cryomyces minteri TaxID=331657 RepID=A0A4U0XJ82_9PEZI|nr:hypothetical protein B0A49_04277 [Cryomyces minteri]
MANAAPQTSNLSVAPYYQQANASTNKHPYQRAQEDYDLSAQTLSNAAMYSEPSHNGGFSEDIQSQSLSSLLQAANSATEQGPASRNPVHGADITGASQDYGVRDISQAEAALASLRNGARNKRKRSVSVEEVEPISNNGEGHSFEDDDPQEWRKRPKKTLRFRPVVVQNIQHEGINDHAQTENIHYAFADTQHALEIEFLDGGEGAKYFGSGTTNAEGQQRQFNWPNDVNKVISLCTPLLRRMVTNERQRQYAIETRKHGGSIGGKRANSDNGTIDESGLAESPRPAAENATSNGTDLGYQHASLQTSAPTLSNHAYESALEMRQAAQGATQMGHIYILGKDYALQEPRTEVPADHSLTWDFMVQILCRKMIVYDEQTILNGGSLADTGQRRDVSFVSTQRKPSFVANTDAMAETQEGWHTTDDGAKLYMKTWKASGPPKARLVFIHGFSDHCNAYGIFFPTLASHGIEVLSFDQRGWGRSVHTPAQRGLSGPTSRVLADITSFLRSVAPTSTSAPAAPLFLMGHSMGGAEVLTYAAQGAPELRARLRGVLAESPFVALHPATRPFRATVLAGRLVGKLLPHAQLVQRLEPALLSRDVAVQRAFVDDPLCHDTGTLEGLAGMLQRGEDLERGRVRVRGDAGEGGEARLAFCAGLEVADKEFKAYDGWFHKLHAEPGEDKVTFATDVAAWVLARSGPLESKPKL